MSGATSTQTSTNPLCIVTIPKDVNIYSVLDFGTSKSWGLVEMAPGVIYQGSWIGDVFQDVVAAVNVNLKKLLCLYSVSDNSATEYIDVNECYEGTCFIENSGNYWEGTLYQGIPWGYGCIRTKSGEFVYEGFRFYTNNICYGKLFSNGQVIYDGMICNNNRHGIATFSTDGNPYWIYDQDSITTEVTMDPSSKSEINSFISQLTLSDSCFPYLSSLYLHELPNLATITIGAYCFLGSDLGSLCSIHDLPYLKSIHIGEHSFTNTESFSLSNLPNLTHVTIDKNCFELTSSFNFSHLASLPSLDWKTSNLKNFKEIVFDDLPQLQKITTFSPVEIKVSTVSDRKLVLRNLPKLRNISDNCFFMYFCQEFYIDNVPILTYDPNSFWFMKATAVKCKDSIHFFDLPQVSQQEQEAEYKQYIESLKSETEWTLPEYSIHRFHYEVGLSLSFYPFKTVAFEKNCFSRFSSLQFSACLKLQSLSIGDNCFLWRRKGKFALVNCPNLKTVKIGANCFKYATKFIIDTPSSELEVVIGMNSFIFINRFAIIGKQTSLSLIVDELGCFGNGDSANQLELRGISHLLSCQLSNGAFERFDNVQLNDDLLVHGENVKFKNPNVFLQECSKHLDPTKVVDTNELSLYDFLV